MPDGSDIVIPAGVMYRDGKSWLEEIDLDNDADYAEFRKMYIDKEYSDFESSQDKIESFDDFRPIRAQHCEDKLAAWDGCLHHDRPFAVPDDADILRDKLRQERLEHKAAFNLSWIVAAQGDGDNMLESDIMMKPGKRVGFVMGYANFEEVVRPGEAPVQASYLRDLYVKPEERCKGHGKSGLKMMEMYFQHQGCEVGKLLFGARNFVAFNLYATRGWEFNGRVNPMNQQEYVTDEQEQAELNALLDCRPAEEATGYRRMLKDYRSKTMKKDYHPNKSRAPQ